MQWIVDQVLVSADKDLLTVLALVTLLLVVLHAGIRLIACRPLRNGTEKQLVTAAKQQTHLLESLRGMQSVEVAGDDVARLQSLPFNDQKKACIAAMADNDAARAQGLADPEGATRERWLRITRRSLIAYDVVFAQVPMWHLDGANGVLATLQADGYQVRSPE